MTAQGITRARDRAAGRLPATAIDTAPLTGTWVTFDPAARGIVRVGIDADGGKLLLRVTETADGTAERPEPGPGTGPLVWDTVTAAPLTGEVGTGHAVGFVAAVDGAPGSRKAVLCGYLNRGLLTVDVSIARLVDGHPANTMYRAHYYRPEAAVRP
ncbi:hypothetical protein [Streptomyces sp. NPDC053048]|uniref:hypothetical protein n=1 Tax=Streptomyces sp. NPDC053048 TaxID=3365694 RepID=UPI0037CFA0C9